MVGSESLFVIGNDAARIYIRYSKLHPDGRTFFGLRQIDLRKMEGQNSYLCFLTDDSGLPIFAPYADFEEMFRNSEPAADGQYKVQLSVRDEGRELYIARQGRFNIEGYVGYDTLATGLETSRLATIEPLTHSGVQTLLAGIGHAKGYDVFVPASDEGRLDWALTEQFPLRHDVPSTFDHVKGVLCEIDVLWLGRGAQSIKGLFEVEHSTAVYSGLLRFNDIFLTDPRLSQFVIVSNDTRRALFARQINRPTFRTSGLADVTSFLQYANVAAWHERVTKWRSREESAETR